MKYSAEVSIDWNDEFDEEIKTNKKKNIKKTDAISDNAYHKLIIIRNSGSLNEFFMLISFTLHMLPHKLCSFLSFCLKF